MLVLTRKEGEALRIGADVRVVLLGVSGGHVRIGIEAPRELTVLREEVHERVVAANRDAATPAGLDLEAVAGWIHPQTDAPPERRSDRTDRGVAPAVSSTSGRTTRATEEKTGRE